MAELMKFFNSIEEVKELDLSKPTKLFYYYGRMRKGFSIKGKVSNGDYGWSLHANYQYCLRFLFDVGAVRWEDMPELKVREVEEWVRPRVKTDVGPMLLDYVIIEGLDKYLGEVGQQLWGNKPGVAHLHRTGATQTLPTDEEVKEVCKVAGLKKINGIVDALTIPNEDKFFCPNIFDELNPTL